MPGTKSPVAPEQAVVRNFTAVCYLDERGNQMICVWVRGSDDLAHIAYWDGTEWRSAKAPETTSFAVDPRRADRVRVFHWDGVNNRMVEATEAG
jgi:hypothetical protein